MERILKHNFEGISLDTNNLSRMAESLTRDRPGLHRLTDLHEQEADDLAIEEEVCTIVPVEDTTTRLSTLLLHTYEILMYKKTILVNFPTGTSP
jgi:hypothetical protein